MTTLQDRIDSLQAATAHGSGLEHVMLREATIAVSPNGTENGGLSSTHLVIFESRRQAIHKPFAAQNPTACRTYCQVPSEAPTHEVVAWRLAYAMGDPWRQLIPTAVLRDLAETGPGALMNFREGERVFAQVAEHARSQALAAGFWDALIGQQDRHAINFKYDVGSKRLALLDHAFAFAREGDFFHASMFLAYRRSVHAQSLRENEYVALRALLESGDLHGLAGFLPDDRASSLERRAQTMLTKGFLPLPGAF